MKASLHIKFLISFAVLIFTLTTQAQSCIPLIPPTLVGGVVVTSTSTGGVSSYPFPFTSCGIYTTPASSVHLGPDVFSYTLNFSVPVNCLNFILTATGGDNNEDFVFTTNTGTPSIIDNGSCFTIITGNTILSGFGGGASGGGGGDFTIVNPSPFTSLTITGSGLDNGSLFALCAASVNASIIEKYSSICDGDSIYLGGAFQTAVGIYYDTLVGVSSCGTDIITRTNLSVYNLPSLTIDPITDLCIDGASITLQANPAGGTFSGTGVSGNSFNPAISGAGPQTITYNYTDGNGCIASTTTSVTVNSKPVFIVSKTDPSCGNSNGEIVITPGSGVTITDYSIDNGTTTQGGGTFSNLNVGSFMIYVKDNNGCEATGTEILNNVGSTDNASFSLSNFCEGAPNNAVVTGTTGGTFSIISPTGDGATINASTGEITDGLGGTTYTIQYQTNGTCPNSFTEQVTIKSSPNVGFTATPESGVAPIIVEFENTTLGSVNYTWDFGDGDIIQNNNDILTHTYDSTGSYIIILTGENANGCLDTATKQIFVISPPVEYTFPNIFTPNDDGKNDYFMLINYEGLKELKIIVLNRWGEVVFEDDKADFKWNGKVKNSGAECVDGTYFYKAEFKDLDGIKKLEHGFVQLSRGK